MRLRLEIQQVPLKILYYQNCIAQVQLELNEPPPGVSIREVSPAGAGMAVVLSADGAKAEPGLKGRNAQGVHDRVVSRNNP